MIDRNCHDKRLAHDKDSLSRQRVLSRDKLHIVVKKKTPGFGASHHHPFQDLIVEKLIIEKKVGEKII